jgi:hypothetical protein
MAWTDLLPHFPGLLAQAVQETGHQLTITLISTRLSATCPTCQTCTQTGHGWFTRRIHSLPCSGRAVVFSVQARRFRCPNPTALAGPFGKISQPWLAAIKDALKQRPVCCTAWVQWREDRLACGSPKRCRCPPAAPPCCAASLVRSHAQRVPHGGGYCRFRLDKGAPLRHNLGGSGNPSPAGPLTRLRGGNRGRLVHPASKRADRHP